MSGRQARRRRREAPPEFEITLDVGFDYFVDGVVVQVWDQATGLQVMQGHLQWAEDYGLPEAALMFVQAMTGTLDGFSGHEAYLDACHQGSVRDHVAVAREGLKSDEEHEHHLATMLQVPGVCSDRLH